MINNNKKIGEENTISPDAAQAMRARSIESTCARARATKRIEIATNTKAQFARKVDRTGCGSAPSAVMASIDSTPSGLHAETERR